METSIRLFNRSGVQNVSFEHIAHAMRASPGTLTYHFRRKDDLMHALLGSLELRMREVLVPPRLKGEPEYGGIYLRNILRAFWDFRFFFNALTFLLSKNPKLRKKYFAFHAWAIDTIVDDYGQMVIAGHFALPRAPNNIRLVALNMWNQWLSWLRMQQIESPHATMPDGDAFYACALLHWSIMEPYFSAEFAKGLLPVYKEFFLKSESPKRKPRASLGPTPINLHDPPPTS